MWVVLLVNVAAHSMETEPLQDFKYKIRGKDFLLLLGWYLARQVGKGGNKYKDPDVIRAMIFPTVDAKLLGKEKLFKNILNKYCR